jgi:hypothetical protein
LRCQTQPTLSTVYHWNLPSVPNLFGDDSSSLFIACRAMRRCSAGGCRAGSFHSFGGQYRHDLGIAAACLCERFGSVLS